MSFSSEQLNFFKFSCVVLDEFPVALRKVFASMWDALIASPPGIPKWDDSVTLLNLLHAKEGGVKKVPTLDKSFKEWDCTALFKATLFAQTFAIPDGSGGVSTLHKLYVRPRALSAGTFHPSVISPSGNQAETYALALDQLRLLRNTLCHQISTRKIDKATFDHYILLAKDVFNAFGQDTTRIDEIGMLADEDFPTARLRQVEAELKREKDAAIKFKQIDDHLTKIESQMEDVSSDVKEIKAVVIQAGCSKDVSGQYAEPAPMETNLTAPACTGGVSKEGKWKRSLSPPTPQDSKRLKVIKVVKDGSPTDEELDDLSKTIAEKWKPLGRKLKIKEGKLTKFHKENEEYDEKALKMLLHWKNEGGSAATYQVLNEALKGVERTDLAEEFCQVDASA